MGSARGRPGLFTFFYPEAQVDQCVLLGMHCITDDASCVSVGMKWVSHSALLGGVPVSPGTSHRSGGPYQPSGRRALGLASFHSRPHYVSSCNGCVGQVMGLGLHL